MTFPIRGDGLSAAAFEASRREIGSYRTTDAIRHRWRVMWEADWLDTHPDDWYEAEVARMAERAPA